MRGMQTRDLARLGLMGSAGVILFLLEGMAPRPLPWIKLGLGNLPVLLALLEYGPGAGLVVSLVKLLIGGFLSGGLGGPAFAIGGAAGLASLLAMALAHQSHPGRFSPVGLSILGAVTHQLTQLAAAWIYIGQSGIFALLPLFLLGGLLSGGLIGLLVFWIQERLAGTRRSEREENTALPPE